MLVRKFFSKTLFSILQSRENLIIVSKKWHVPKLSVFLPGRLRISTRQKNEEDDSLMCNLAINTTSRTFHLLLNVLFIYIYIYTHNLLNTSNESRCNVFLSFTATQRQLFSHLHYRRCISLVFPLPSFDFPLVPFLYGRAIVSTATERSSKFRNFDSLDRLDCLRLSLGILADDNSGVHLL